MTRVWVDADACPRPVKEILFRAAGKRKVELVLVANATLVVPRSQYIRCVTQPRHFDAADDYIVEQALAGDLVITQDIPLAAQLVEQGVAVVNPHGQEFNRDNVGERLVMRNMMDEMRGAGVRTGGPLPFGEREKQTFANSFDRILTRLLNAHQAKGIS